MPCTYKYKILIIFVSFLQFTVRDIKIEKSENGSRLKEFNNVMEKTLAMTKGHPQNEQLANYQFVAQHLKITIISG